MTDSGPAATVELSPRLTDAFDLARRLHASQCRKGGSIPYLGHLMAVASLVIEDGGDEDEVIAALLHDAVEDQGGPPTLQAIREQFGDHVAGIVDACSDTDQQPKPPWRRRKEDYVEHLEHAEGAVLRVSLADKLHNARALLLDYRTYGPAFWARFAAGPTDQLWYYRALADAFGRRHPGPQADELRRVVEDLAHLVETPTRSDEQVGHHARSANSAGSAMQLENILRAALPALASRRPLFHSEADFQQALAWELQTQHPSGQIRLERRILDQPRVNLDVLAVIDGVRFGLELNIRRAPLKTTIEAEDFALITGTGDLDRYDTIKDLVRLELLLSHQLIDAGAAIVLSNHRGFWQPPRTARATSFDAFRVHTGAVISGTVDWRPSAGVGTRKGRNAPHALSGIYRPIWQPYARVPSARNGELRTLTLIVPPEGTT